ncbi:MAG: hypothetical protein EBR02_09065 [Alphaproteobacteria bacterium]|nr:hypothetical protein [Alphaproteobacteria bacterium]
MEDIIDKVVEADEGKSLNPAEFTEGSKHSLISMLAALIDASTKLEKIKKPESQTASALPDIQVSEGDALLVRAYLERVSKKNEEPNDASLS